MKRIIWHWTAGGHKANSTDLKHYHLIIQDDGTVMSGTHPISANAAPLSKSYAAHTARLNTDSIGLAVAAMRGAKERPFNHGPSPITTAQVQQLAKTTATLCKRYNIPVSRETTLSHAEVEPTLGVKQAGKWDITWLPGMSAPADPVEVGDRLRSLTQDYMAVKKPKDKKGLGLIAFILIIIGAIIAFIKGG
jgi:N-acetyl-anhydromuramyl-L-alanine amidase AmpD